MSEPSNKRKKSEHPTQVYNYDFTYYGKDAILPDHEEFIKLIRPLFKKWAFQLEECPTTGTKHYQGRGSLFKKKRHPELCGLLNSTPLRGMKVSESSNNSLTDEIFYMLKYDTRVDGPWQDNTYTAPEYIPRQYRGLLERLHPWQKHIIDSRTDFNDRVINLVYDAKGCNGKSTLACLSQLHYKGFDVPPIGDHKELTQAVCDYLMARQLRDPDFIFIDFPRALTMEGGKKLAPFMVAIEQIKKGHVADVRNHYKEWWFDSPQVWVFTNHPVDPRFMSKDRWKFYGISGFKTLYEISHMQMSQMSQDSEL